jgi:hypothetical protein
MIGSVLLCVWGTRQETIEDAARFFHWQLSNEGSAMAQTLPWPVTDDELALNRALENVVAAYGDAGPLEAAWLREIAANLIIEAYDQGVRDEDVLVRQVLKTLRRGRPGN